MAVVRGVLTRRRAYSTTRPIPPPLARPPSLPTPQQVHESNEPLLLPGLVSRPTSDNGYPWSALHKWAHRDPHTGQETLHGMRNKYTANLLVDVEIGRKGHGYMEGQGKWDKIRMPFGERWVCGE